MQGSRSIEDNRCKENSDIISCFHCFVFTMNFSQEFFVSGSSTLKQ
jgi:hypothetical protein